MIIEPGGTLDTAAVDEALTAVCQIQDPPTLGAFNESTLGTTWVDGATIHAALPCRVFRRNAAQSARDAGLQLNVDESIVKVPADTTGIRVEQLLVVTSAPTPSLVGVRFEITRVQPRSSAATLTLEVVRWVQSQSGRVTA